MKKTAALLCAIMLAFGIPAAAFGETLEVASNDIQPRDLNDSFGGQEDDDADKNMVYTAAGDLIANGETVGAVSGMKIVVNKHADTASQNFGTSTGFPRFASAPTPYAVDDSMTVLSAGAFTISCSKSGTPLDAFPAGGSIEFTYQADQNFVKDLAKENDIQPSDIQLFIYEKERGGAVQKFATGTSAADSVKVGPTEFRAGTFVMALACDSSLLSKAEAQPKPKPSSSSETFVGIDPVEIPVVAAGEDESDLSPKTGQALPAGAAPAALLVAGVLGGAAVIAARRRSMR